MDTEESILHALDDELLALTKKVTLLKYLTPTNLVAEREKFLQQEGNYDPQFSYNFPKEEEIHSRIQELENMQNKYFGNKTYKNPISKLLSDKLEENITTAQLLLAYSKQDFVNIEKYNILLYWSFDPEILQQAEEILQSYQEPKSALRWEILTGDEIQHYILDYMQRKDITGVEIIPSEQSTAKFVIAFGQSICRLFYSPKMKIRKYTLEADLIHELWVHYTRYMNGKKTGRNILTFGTKNYLTDEEGLALYHVCAYKKTIYPAFQKTWIYQKYLLLQYGQSKSFREMAKYIQDKQRSKNLTTIFTMVMRCKQGIQDTSLHAPWTIFLKNKLYADGYHRILHWIEQGNDVGKLFRGKITIEDLAYLD